MISAQRCSVSFSKVKRKCFSCVCNTFAQSWLSSYRSDQATILEVPLHPDSERECPLLAQSRHSAECPLLGVKRTWHGHALMSASLIGGVKRFQAIRHCGVDVARGLVLLSGLGARALPSWDPRTRWNNLLSGLSVKRTIGPSRHANSPHPSSREGHYSTAWWSSSFLLSHLMVSGP